MSQNLPYQSKNAVTMAELIKKNQRQALPVIYKKDLRDLVDKMLSIDIKKRISIKEIIHSKAFRDIHL